MKAGETVRDSAGRIYQVGQQLGRGLWGRVYSARDEAAGLDCVLKVPLAAADLGDDEKLAAAVREIAIEQARLHEAQAELGLVPLLGRVALPDGGTALVLAKMPNSLEKRLLAGAPLEELLHGVIAVVKVLRAFEDPFHGNLKPSNIFVDGDGKVLLADVVTPATRRVMAALLGHAGPDHPYLAPEVRAAAASAPLGPPTDAYALAMALYRGAMATPGGADRFPELPLEGLDKAKVVTLKDRVVNRLRREPSNPRFHTRLAERFAALLNRALSRETSPSPPYRFRRLDELMGRLDEIVALVHPTVTHAGKLIFDLKGGAESFTTEDNLSFSCTVATTSGVETHEEIACGLAFFDADTDQRLRNLQCAYSVDRHPSGRFRFLFKLEGVNPGAYRVRVAYAIRESGEEPHTTEAGFRVRAAPGYVPPKVEPGPTAIPLDRDDDLGPPTDAGLRGPRRDRPAEPVRAEAPRAGLLAPVVPLRPGLEAEEGNTFPAVPLPMPISPISPVESEAPTMPIEPAPIRPAANLSGRVSTRLPDSPAPPREPPPLRELPPPSAKDLRMSVAPPKAIAIPMPTLVPQPPKTSPPPAPPSSPKPAVSTTPARPAVPKARIIAAPPEEPEVKAAGRWSELPLPVAAAAEEPARPRPEKSKPAPLPAPVEPDPMDEDDDDSEEAVGPVAAFIKRAVDMVRGDAYVTFLVIAAVIIIALALALIFLF